MAAIALSVSADPLYQPVYQDDLKLVANLKDLPAGASMVLPQVRVESGGINKFSFEKFGPGQRDYCNKMPYAFDRGTALYAGGNHQVPHRMNDVWEFHLGSNTWHLLYAPDGGNPGQHKGAYFLTSRTLVRKPDTVLNEKQEKQIEAYRQWWKKHVQLKDGHITTIKGGPVMSAHTWDAFSYDPRAGLLIWGMGANPAAQPATYAHFSDQTIEQVNAKLDNRYTPMWMFDTKSRKWIHYRTTKEDTPRASLRGMGATMQYIPELGKTIWYVAAQNVSPAAFEMWTYDALEDHWEELKPNGGKSIGELAGKLKIAPMSEQQVAYSPKDRKLVAVLKHDTFVYDIELNEWSKVDTDEAIYGHDAKSVFAYDQHTDVFLLAFPPQGKGKAMSLAAFSLKTMKWKPVTMVGPSIPQTKYGAYMGYYDPRHKVLVVQGRYVNQMWVYRHK